MSSATDNALDPHRSMRARACSFAGVSRKSFTAPSARAAGLNRFLSFKDWRWPCAVRDLQNGVPAERVRVKLGLSETTWYEAGLRRRLERLVAPAM